MEPGQRGQVASATAGTEAPAQLLKAARRLEPLDPGLARETYLDAWGAALFAGHLATGGDLLDVSRAARAAPPPPDPPQQEHSAFFTHQFTGMWLTGPM